MSHKTEVKMALTNKGFLKKVLDKLGFTYTEAKEGQTIQTTSRFQNANSGVNIRLETQKGRHLEGAIGFREEKDGTWTAVGDFYGLAFEDGERMTVENLKNKVTARSKEAEIQEHLMQLGFEMSLENAQSKNGIQTMTYERWV